MSDVRWRFTFGLLLATMGSRAWAQAAPAPPPANPNAIIVTAPGGLFDRLETEAVASDQIRGAGQPDLLGALGRSVPGLSLQEAQGNPFQPNLVYRGFTASPLQGQAQGLAVYLDGGRFNQPFGDTVQFDLLPQAAIQRVDIFDSSPVYGLNALGGAIVIQTKTGRDSPGVFVSADAGDHGQANATAEAGWSGSRTSGYIAVQRSHDSGWRRFSPSALLNGFADLGWEGDTAGVHMKLVGAETDLTGNGSAPVQLLSADERAVFTHPDNTRHHYVRASLHPWWKLTDSVRLQASLYWQRLRQRTVNGDTADISACDAAAALLCLEDAGGQQSSLIASTGAPVAALAGASPYGVLNASRSTSTGSGLLAQLVDRQKIAGHANVLVLGVSRDASHTGFTSSSELGLLTLDRGVDGLGPIIAQPDGSITPVSLVAHTLYSGLFASDRFALSHALTAVVDLRWNDARINLRDRIGTSLDGAHRYRRVNPGFQLEWRLGSATELRAGYSEANRAPTPAELSCADPQAPCSLTNFFVGDPPLKQVVAHSFELGGEGKLGAVEWLVSAYRTTNANDIQYVASETRGRAFFRNVGSTRRQGLEATLGYTKGGFTLHAGYAFTDATFRTRFVLNSPDNPRADANAQIMVEPGDALPGVPRHRGLLSADYRAKRWSIGGDLQVASGQYYFGDEANLIGTTAAYAVADLRGSVQLIGPVSLFGEVRNLFDRHYATFGTFSETSAINLVETPGATDPRSISPGAPRRWLVGLKARF